MTPFYAERCCRLVSAHTMSVWILRQVNTSQMSDVIIMSYHVVDFKQQNRLKVGTDQPKLKVKMQSVSDGDDIAFDVITAVCLHQ